MQAAAIVPNATNTEIMPLPFETLSDRSATFFSNLCIDVIKLFILSAHNFSCEESLMPTL